MCNEFWTHYEASSGNTPSLNVHTRKLQWVIPEKIHTPPPPPMDGTLEILTGGGVEGSGNPGGRGGLDLKIFFRGHFHLDLLGL